MKRWILALVALAVLAIDWAALHDISSGQPNPWQEWLFPGASAIFLGVLVRRRFA